MKKIFFLLITVQFIIVGQVNWNTPSIVSSINVSENDIIESYTNSAGSHIAANSNGTIKYYLINSSGQKIRENLNLDIGCEYSENNYTVAITGYENDVYIVYQKANKIKIIKSTNAGVSWSTIPERTITNNNCNGIDAAFDNRGLHIVWAIKIGNNFETYYERYRSSVPFVWEGFKQITDYDANDIGGRPSVTTSENKVHVAYNMNTSEQTITISGPAKTRDFNFLTNSWEVPQWIEIEPSRIPEPFPGAEIDFTCSNIERITYGGGYIHLINHQLVAVGNTVFHYLYYKRRPVTSSNWDTENLVSMDIVFPQRLVKPLYTPNGRVNVLCLKGVYAEYKHYYLVNNIKYGPYNITYWDPSVLINGACCFSANSNDLYAFWLAGDPLSLFCSKYDANPLAPLNLTATTVNNHPRLSWTKNNEADLKEYIIDRAVANSWTYDIARTTNNSFIDNGVLIHPVLDDHISYKIRAVDMQNHISAPSNTVNIQHGVLMKENDGSNDKTSTSYHLENAYPNPFNPSTKISFSIKEEGSVTLKVYDVLGKEVATLVNENKPEGYYEVEFDASHLPSGMYVYSIQAGEFAESKKMLLMK